MQTLPSAAHLSCCAPLLRRCSAARLPARCSMVQAGWPTRRVSLDGVGREEKWQSSPHACLSAAFAASASRGSASLLTASVMVMRAAPPLCAHARAAGVQLAREAVAAPMQRLAVLHCAPMSSDGALAMSRGGLHGCICGGSGAARCGLSSWLAGGQYLVPGAAPMRLGWPLMPAGMRWGTGQPPGMAVQLVHRCRARWAWAPLYVLLDASRATTEPLRGRAAAAQGRRRTRLLPGARYGLRRARAAPRKGTCPVFLPRPRTTPAAASPGAGRALGTGSLPAARAVHCHWAARIRPDTLPLRAWEQHGRGQALGSGLPLLRARTRAHARAPACAARQALTLCFAASLPGRAGALERRGMAVRRRGAVRRRWHQRAAVVAKRRHGLVSPSRAARRRAAAMLPCCAAARCGLR